MDARPVMVGLGELLWDILPSGKVLGGAPANFAYMSTVLGNCGIVASRIGEDYLGREAVKTIEQREMDPRYLQQDRLHSTGTASVQLDSNGQPRFTIHEPAAWDFLAWTPDWQELAERADVICFGSLAQRSPVSARTIELFLRRPSKCLLICDANLREPFYATEALSTSFKIAHVLKLNDSELLRIASLFGIAGDDEEELASQLLRRFDLELICITKGARGSLLMSSRKSVRHTGLRVEVADAIGAGDAFTACVAHYYLRDESLEKISNYANRFASWVATQVGATPLISPGQLEEILTIESSGNSQVSA